MYPIEKYPQNKSSQDSTQKNIFGLNYMNKISLVYPDNAQEQ